MTILSSDVPIAVIRECGFSWKAIRLLCDSWWLSETMDVSVELVLDGVEVLETSTSLFCIDRFGLTNTAVSC